MSDDLRERIAQALIRERQRRLAGVSMDVALADADAVLAVVRPVIEQAERERVYGSRSELARRLATLEAALDRIAHHPITQSSDAVTLRQIARDALDAQDTIPAPPPRKRCPTCGSDDPARQQGLPHTDLHAQVRCRDPWHSTPPVEKAL